MFNTITQKEAIPEHTYLLALQYAQTLEKTSLTILEKMLIDYPEHGLHLRAHIQETHEQQALIQSVIDRYPNVTPLMKVALGQVHCLGLAMKGKQTFERALKRRDALSCYAFEHIEVANYTSLIHLAELVGDLDGVRIFEHIIEQELAMGRWVFAHLPVLDTVQYFYHPDFGKNS